MKQLILALSLVALVAAAYWATQREAPAPVPPFAELPAGDARKQAFFDYFAPLIAAENAALLEQRKQLLEWREQGGAGWWQRGKLEALASNYFMEDFDPSSDEDWDELLERVNVIPVSLALAQAAKESGWGTSRFATSANNYFGEWCFKPGCGVVPGKRNAGAQHELATFDSPAASVRSYLRNLNRHRAYAGLRDIRAQAENRGERRDGVALAAGLAQYSERGQAYVEEVRSMIRYNKLEKYDTCAERC